MTPPDSGVVERCPSWEAQLANNNPTKVRTGTATRICITSSLSLARWSMWLEDCGSTALHPAPVTNQRGPERTLRTRHGVHALPLGDFQPQRGRSFSILVASFVDPRPTFRPRPLAVHPPFSVRLIGSPKPCTRPFHPDHPEWLVAPRLHVAVERAPD